MFVATIGTPTTVAHLRVIVNPAAIERTTPRCARDSLVLHVNPNFYSPRTSDEPYWVDEMISELARRTCNGTISKGTNQYISFFPMPDELHNANERLAAAGIRMEINPRADEHGLLNVWLEYTRQPAYNG
jgi:hypothetical protein